VVSNVGALMVSAAGRDAVLAAVTVLAPGNALVILDAAPSGSKGPSQVKLSKAVQEAGGVIRDFKSPKAGGLAAWIDREAKDRGITLAPGAAKELSGRIGGFVDQNDAERRFQTRIASGELDKLALYRGDQPVRIDDVRALVAEAIPGSIWGFVDAVGERKAGRALGLLERLLESTAEPVLIVVLHRRVRELIELGDRLATGETLAAAAKAMGIKSEYRAGTLASQARNWTTPELIDALAGLLELDAMIKGAPGTHGDAAQRRLAFTLWVMEHLERREQRSA
jgi:DNA polymerase III delta subunit